MAPWPGKLPSSLFKRVTIQEKGKGRCSKGKGTAGRGVSHSYKCLGFGPAPEILLNYV